MKILRHEIQTEIITHFPWEILRKIEIFITDKQAPAQNDTAFQSGEKLIVDTFTKIFD